VRVADRDEGPGVGEDRSQRVPIMICSWVSAVAPFQEIFTSEVTGTMRSAQARAPRRGKVPLVVRLSLTPCAAELEDLLEVCRRAAARPSSRG
jgi:hypothetical protein